MAALLAARNDRKDEHKRAQERYKKVRVRSRVALCCRSQLFRVHVHGRYAALVYTGAPSACVPTRFTSKCSSLYQHFQDCEEFDKKVEKLQGEKERRMEECLDELRGLEDGYRQKHRDAKQV